MSNVEQTLMKTFHNRKDKGFLLKGQIFRYSKYVPRKDDEMIYIRDRWKSNIFSTISHSLNMSFRETYVLQTRDIDMKNKIYLVYYGFAYVHFKYSLCFVDYLYIFQKSNLSCWIYLTSIASLMLQ